jgi:hypothetical protein
MGSFILSASSCDRGRPVLLRLALMVAADLCPPMPRRQSECALEIKMPSNRASGRAIQNTNGAQRDQGERSHSPQTAKKNLDRKLDKGR